MLDHADGRLARFKHPAKAMFVTEIPRNPSGNALKKELRVQFEGLQL